MWRKKNNVCIWVYPGRDLKIIIKDYIKMWDLIITHNSKTIGGRFTKFSTIGVDRIAWVCCKSRVSTWIRSTSAGIQSRRYCCCYYSFVATLFFRSLPSNSGVFVFLGIPWLIPFSSFFSSLSSYKQKTRSTLFINRSLKYWTPFVNFWQVPVEPVRN